MHITRFCCILLWLGEVHCSHFLRFTQHIETETKWPPYSSTGSDKVLAPCRWQTINYLNQWCLVGWCIYAPLHLNNYHNIAPVPVKQPWRIWVEDYINPLWTDLKLNLRKPKHDKSRARFVAYTLRTHIWICWSYIPWAVVYAMYTNYRIHCHGDLLYFFWIM